MRIERFLKLPDQRSSSSGASDDNAVSGRSCSGGGGGGRGNFPGDSRSSVVTQANDNARSNRSSLCLRLRCSGISSVADNNVVPNSGDWRQSSGLCSDDNFPWRRRERFTGEEGGALVFSDGVGVQVVAGAGQAGHGVAWGGAHAAFGQMKSSSGKISSRSSIKRINFKPQLQLPASGADNCSRRSSSNLEQTLLDDPVSEAIRDVVKQPQDTVGIHPAIGSLLGPIGAEDLLPVLTSVRLEPEESVSAQISLDMILGCKVLC